MKNKLVKILGLAVGAGLLFTPLKKASAEDFYFYGKLGFGGGVGSNPFKISSAESPYLPSINLDADLGIGFRSNLSDYFSDSKIGFRLSGIHAGAIIPSQYSVNNFTYTGPEDGSFSLGFYARTSLLSLDREVRVEDVVVDRETSGAFAEFDISLPQQIWLGHDTFAPELAEIINPKVKVGYEKRGNLGDKSEVSGDLFAGVSFPIITGETFTGTSNCFSVVPDVFVGYSFDFYFNSK